MKLVYTSRTLFMAAHVRNLLQEEGIACVLRNEFIGAAAGELPPTECWPEVWVVDDGDAGRAEALVSAAAASPPDTPWQCPRCGERVEGNFGQCWQCGTLRPEA